VLCHVVCLNNVTTSHLIVFVFQMLDVEEEVATPDGQMNNY